ncbi:MAG: HlyD family efflux transporter periplasmic adaptor subunit [Planctomycetota bacterium]|nr:MAG: HlyD family efflux transporter periplasmic adaptor subunit [Planctomycetota bacterium]
MNRASLFCAATLALVATSTALATAAEVEVSSVLVKLIEQVEVPAREAGVLEQVDVREGQMVEEGAEIARIDDSAPRLDKRTAELELVAAAKMAENDVKVRYARKSAEVADAELQRAVKSKQRLPDSVTDSEMDQLRLMAEKTILEIEQAELEFDLAKTTRALKENDVQIAEHDISQRKITAPLAGFVSEVSRHRGEWVQPGQTIVRILRLDRLRAEGLVDAEAVSAELVDRPVRLTVNQAGQAVQFEGKIVFVSPEIDPVNGQVRVWAEIENRDLQLRPGLHGSMVIEEAPAASVSSVSR